ncbi:MAG: hypothetical protein E6J23_14035 [Chloroflexi bacterium]|nr:MAG: hypothetical protein E6J23_14035 [Chloroflexota bacterium]
MTLRRPLRIVLVAAAAAFVAVLLFPAFLALRADGNQIIEPQAMDYALLAVATSLIAGGAQLVPWKAEPYIAFLGVLGAAALLFGILGAFGIGLAFLPLAIVAVVLLFRALRRRPLSTGRPAAIGGALAGYGAILLYIALIVPATVECFANGGGSTSSQRWDRSGGGYAMSGGGSTAGGIQTGRIESATSIATYRCEQGRVVEFRRVSR